MEMIPVKYRGEFRVKFLLAVLVAFLVSGSSMSGADATEQELLEKDLISIEHRLEGLKGSPAVSMDLWADAAVYAKAARWGIDYSSPLTPDALQQVRHGVHLADERLKQIENRSEEPGWLATTNRSVARGFVSSIDQSVQPVGVILPAEFDAHRDYRLDVVLHGSQRPNGMCDLKFLSRFESGHARHTSPDLNVIELHPQGRVENGYRWAGETDVFEAIEWACRNYRIHQKQIVLRGMSMGASGTWHLGLKRPDRFAALGPYCGYVETHEFSRTPGMHFVEVGPLPEIQEKMLHLLDSRDYAGNAATVPVVACIGEKDVFFNAHELMRQAFEKEGLPFVNLISPGTGHVLDPVTHREQLARIEQQLAAAPDGPPLQIRFVTWSLKYARCHWIELLGLARHYDRAEIRAERSPAGLIDVTLLTNITRFSIEAPLLDPAESKVRILGEEIALPSIGENGTRGTLLFEQHDGKWACMGILDRARLSGKQPGLQGPIDDVFTSPFVCVRGTGTPWSPAVQEWADANLKRFEEEWREFFRGALPVIDDVSLSSDDLQSKNLILFGDPGSNLWIARLLPHLPLQWTRDTIQVGEESFTAGEHAAVCIAPNPLAAGQKHAVVINSGHTFHRQELNTLNYLLYPRLGDWAIMKIDPANPGNMTPSGDSEPVIRTGFFDENWRVPVGNPARID